MASNPFTDQVRLLVALLPSVAKQECFALKGGTAINLLVDEIHAALTDADRRFLVSLKEGVQEWRDFPLPGVEQLPSIRWKMFNIARMAPEKRQQSVDKLKAILFER